MKNQSLKISFALFIFIISFTSCSKDWYGVEGRGGIHTESRNFTEFTGVDFQLAGRVIIVPDSQYSVRVSTFENYQSLIHIAVHGGVLVINSTKSLHDDDINIEIHLPYLDYINLGGSGSIITQNHFSSTNMKVQITGSGTIDYSGDVTSLNTNVSGSGKITLLGTADNSTMKMSGSGKVRGFAMRCKQNNVSISGSGVIETYVNNSLTVNISGSGKVYYMGNPTLSQHISGSGKIIHQP